MNDSQSCNVDIVAVVILEQAHGIDRSTEGSILAAQQAVELRRMAIDADVDFAAGLPYQLEDSMVLQQDSVGRQ